MSIDFRQYKVGEFQRLLTNEKVAVIGAGGIGCELLKTLVLLGFGHIVIVDLDTVDVSNLNRQFLFQKEDVGRSKAEVAKAKVKDLNPDVKIEAICAKLEEKSFGIRWFTQFSVVFSALDNIESRRFVNRMCIYSSVPFIESGTAGYLGQCQPIIPNITECYECYPKPVPTSFPVCTIRTTPSETIHCVVWAKDHLFQNIFGIEEFRNIEENDDGVANMGIRRMIKGEGSTEMLASKLFQQVFVEEIDALIASNTLRGSFQTLRELKFLIDVPRKNSKEMDTKLQAHRTLPISEYYNKFLISSEKLLKRFLGLELEKCFIFDKDDIDMIEFVTSATNLRAFIFNIPLKSMFEIKQMAGNIIAAIPATNSIVAAMSVSQALNILDKSWNLLKTIFITRRNNNHFSTANSYPNPDCNVCGISTYFLNVNFNLAKLSDLVEVIKQLGLSDDVSILYKNLIYDIDYSDNLEKNLITLGVYDGCVLSIINEDEGIKEKGFNIILFADSDAKKPLKFKNIRTALKIEQE